MAKRIQRLSYGIHQPVWIVLRWDKLIERDCTTCDGDGGLQLVKGGEVTCEDCGGTGRMRGSRKEYKVVEGVIVQGSISETGTIYHIRFQYGKDIMGKVKPYVSMIDGKDVFDSKDVAEQECMRRMVEAYKVAGKEV